MRILSLLVVPFAAVMIAACGGGGSSTATTAPQRTTTPGTTSSTGTSGALDTPTPGGGLAALDPCTVFTKEQAAAVLGAAFGEGNKTSEGQLQQCVYDSVSTGSSIRVVVSVGTKATDKTAFAKLLVEDKNALPSNNGSTQPIASIGDAAYITDRGLAALKGNRVVIIYLSPSAKPGDLQIMMQAALQRIS